ncbi:MAG: FadR/GntR family transcriptional regulator [Myxococcota bacterium]
MSSITQDVSIAAALRDDILRGQYRRGERLPSERDLAERFGVHRSTVRAAFKRLEQLGIADIRQGGARVNPIEEASLEVVEHLLALETPPNPELVDQTLETLSGFLAMAARLGTERASDEQRAQMVALIHEMIEAPDAEERRSERFRSLCDAFVEASGNLVLRLVQHGLRTRYSDYLPPNFRRDQSEESVTQGSIHSPLKHLSQAIIDRNGPGASEALLDLTNTVRAHLRAQLEMSRRDLAQTKPTFGAALPATPTSPAAATVATAVKESAR